MKLLNTIGLEEIYEEVELKGCPHHNIDDGIQECLDCGKDLSHLYTEDEE